ncbi:MAG: hypothetical protein HY719_02810 [Planctomycetes bacterium]|nr:hypothetical protein [Planctomycetota bacterium]
MSEDPAFDAAIEMTAAMPVPGPLDAARVRAVRDDPALFDPDEAREIECRFALEMYRGRQMRFLSPGAGEPLEEFRRRPGKAFLNLTRLVIDVLSLLYKAPPERTATGSRTVASRLVRVWSENSMDLLFLAVDRLTRLLGTVAVRPFYEGGRVRYWLYPSHRLRVIEDDSAPWKPRAVVISWTKPAGRSGAAGGGRGQAARRAHVWTAQRFADLTDGVVTDNRAHGYGRVPLTVFRDRWSYEGFFSEGRGAAVAHQNCAVNEKLSDLGYTVKMQGFGVMQVVNPDPRQSLAVGPGNTLVFQVAAGDPYGIEYKSPNAPLEALIADLRFSIEELLRSQRVPESAISVNTVAGASGVAIAAAQSPVIEDRAERVQLFREGETDLVDATLRVIRAHEPGFEFHDDSYRFRVNFPEPEASGSARDRIERDEFLLRHRLIAPWELMFRDNPDGFRDLPEARLLYFRRLRDLAEPPVA